MISLLLAACVPVEDGIDDTFLTGSVRIPPAAEVIEEQSDGRQSPADTLGLAQEVPVGWRWDRVEARMRGFGDPEDDENNPDQDWYVFTPKATGAFTIEFNMSTGAEGPQPPLDTGLPDTGPNDSQPDPDSGDSAVDSAPDTGPAPDPILLQVRLYDLTENAAWGYYDGESLQNALYDSSTQGSGGSLTLAFDELDASHEYALQVEGLSNEDGAIVAYTLDFSGSDPNEAGMVIGAYTDVTDLLNKGPLVAGSTIEGWEYDEESRTWTGSYRMMYFKSVKTEVGRNEVDTGIDIHTVFEGPPDEVFLVGGDFATLNQGLPAGTFYNSAPVSVAMKADTENEASVVVLDTVAPKQIGWEFAEEEPNDPQLNEAEDAWEEGTFLANGTVLPPPSGPGYVDIASGTMVVETEGDGGSYPEPNDVDIFVLNVEEELSVQITTAWSSNDWNFDMSLYDENQEFIGSGYQVADVNPEVMPLSLWEVTLEPGKDYFLVMQTWTGPVGEDAYTIELEWLAP